MLLPRHSQSAIVTQLRAAGCVFAEEEAHILVSAAKTSVDLAAMVSKRIAGFPIEHIVGWVTFAGLRISVDPGVFVPRRKTEFLVRQAALFVHPRTIVVDLCCGCGAIGVALAAAVDYVQLHAVDIEPAAVRCARRNVDAGSHVYEGDLYGPLPPTLRGQVDVVVANVPYVPTKAISFLPTEARQYESTVALDGGVDGLDILRQVAKQAPGWLSSSGHFLVETSGGQASAAMKIMADYGMTGWITRSTQLDATVVVGAWRCP